MTPISKQFLFFVSGAMLLCSAHSWSESASQCSTIADARERLACFDRDFPHPDGPRVRTVPVEEVAPPQVSTSNDSATDTVSGPRKSGASPKESRGLFAWMEEVDFDTEIVALRSGDQQRMVFRLANEQMWMQSSPRRLPYSIGDKVNIKNARMGGYIMRSESGTSTRVLRIE